MRKVIIVLILTTTWLIFNSFTTVDGREEGESADFDTIPHMVYDSYFIQVFDEITRMLEGKEP